jgi:TorA maturation chaperone TorD
MQPLVFKPSLMQRELILMGISNLCRFYWGPDVNQCEEMVAGTFFHPFKELAPLFSEESTQALTVVTDFVKRMPTPTALLDVLHPLHVQLFVSNPQGLVAPPYHSCYLYDGAPLMGPPALQMQQRLDAIGLSMASHMNEPPDHIAIELECLYYMLDMGWATDFQDLLPEAALFAGTEIAEWLPVFRDRLGQTTQPEPYLAGTTLAYELVQVVSRISS